MLYGRARSLFISCRPFLAEIALLTIFRYSAGSCEDTRVTRADLSQAFKVGQALWYRVENHVLDSDKYTYCPATPHLTQFVPNFASTISASNGHQWRGMKVNSARQILLT